MRARWRVLVSVEIGRAREKRAPFTLQRDCCSRARRKPRGRTKYSSLCMHRGSVNFDPPSDILLSLFFVALMCVSRKVQARCIRNAYTNDRSR